MSLWAKTQSLDFWAPRSQGSFCCRFTSLLLPGQSAVAELWRLLLLEALPSPSLESRGGTVDYFLLFSALPFCFSVLFRYLVSFLLTLNLSSSDYSFSFFILTLLIHSCKMEILIHHLSSKQYDFLEFIFILVWMGGFLCMTVHHLHGRSSGTWVTHGSGKGTQGLWKSSQCS